MRIQVRSERRSAREAAVGAICVGSLSARYTNVATMRFTRLQVGISKQILLRYQLCADNDRYYRLVSSQQLLTSWLITTKQSQTMTLYYHMQIYCYPGYSP